MFLSNLILHCLDVIDNNVMYSTRYVAYIFAIVIKGPSVYHVCNFKQYAQN